MATTTKLTASNGFYGYDGYTNSAANHLYVGGETSSTKYDYRSRLTFKPLSSVAAIGSSRIRVIKAVLYLRRNDGGPTRVTAGSSSSGKWSAALAGSGSANIGGSTGWYSIDVTACAEAIAGYGGSWYIHLSGATPRIRLSGTESDYAPYIKITWEYIAATITSDSDEAELGSAVTFTIDPEAAGETHTLTYSIGDQSGVIAERAGDSVAWIPSMELATEFPGDETGEAAIRMTAYDAGGSALRTELYYQTLRAPDSMRPAIKDMGLTVGGNLGGYGLTGRSALTLAPVIDMSAGFGASLTQIRAVITIGATMQELTWTNAAESAPGEYTGAPLTGAVLTEAGEATVHMTATDSRGRTAEDTRRVVVLAYTPPKIDAFGVERYEPVYDANEEVSGYVPSDLGGNVWVNISASVCEIAPEGIQLNSLRWQIDGVSLSRSAVSAEGVSGQNLYVYQDRSIFPAAVDEGESWQYTLTVTDTAGGIAAQYSVILPAHAAMSVSPDKYGFAIGMIAAGNRARPMFEVDKRYKSHFYGGAYGADGYRMDRCEQWEYLNITNGNFTAYSEAFRPRISRVGAIVYLDGMVKNTVDLDANFNQTIATLPEWARPVTDVYAIQQGSGRAVWWQRITAAGAVIIHRYRDESGYKDAAATSQFPLSLSWIAADAFVEHTEGEVIVTYADGTVTLTDMGDLMSVYYDGLGNVSIDRYIGVTVAASDGNVVIDKEG